MVHALELPVVSTRASCGLVEDESVSNEMGVLVPTPRAVPLSWIRESLSVKVEAFQRGR